MKVDLTNVNQAFIVVGICGLVEEEGLTPREAFRLVNAIMKQIFPALMVITEERGTEVLDK